MDNRLDLLLERGLQSEVTKLRFRVRQLTGFDEVEANSEIIDNDFEISTIKSC